MKRLKSYFFTNTNLNSRGKYISLKDNAEPNETLFNDLLDSVVKPKVGSDYQDQADYNAINTKDSTKFTTAENLPEVDTTGSLLTITTTAAVDTSLLRRKKYTVVANIPTVTGDISGRNSNKLVTAANLPKLALDNSDYSAVDAQLPYYDQTITEVTDAGLFSVYKLKMKALTSEMMTHSGFKLSTILDGLRTDVDACVSDVELASAVDTLNTAIGLKATKVTPTFVAGYNGTKVTVNSQGVVTQVSKASASDIANDSTVSGSTVKDALNWLKANGGGTGGASDTDGVTNLSDVSGATTTDALNTLLEATQQYMINDFVVKGVGDTIEINKFNSIVVGADVSYTLPTADVSNYGRSISIVNRSNYEVTINGIVNGSTKLSNYNDTLLLVCLFDGVVTYGWWIISDSMLDKVAGNKKELTGDYTAQRGDSIKADAQSVGADINITIPTAGIEGSVIYVYYPTGAPSSYVVNLIGGYSATLVQLDYFLLRDNGSYWEAISTSQNVSAISSVFGRTGAIVATTGDYNTSQVTENTNLYFTEARVRASLLTGLSIAGSSISGSDSVLGAFGKLQNQINGLLGGSIFQTTWNASTNSPSLASSVGTKGYYYIVSVAGSTNLDGISEWAVGDWAIFDGTVWRKVDNTDAISSFNGSLGAITYTPTGTVNRLTVTGAGGLTPTFDIASTYVGQTSITTLGTIGTGTWQGTAIADAYIASAATWNGKFNTPTGLTVSRLPYWNGTAFVDSRFVRAGDDSAISFMPPSGSNTLSIGVAGIRITGGNIDIVSGSFDGLLVTGRIINRSSDNYAYQVSNSGSNFYFGLGGTNTGVFRTVSNICMSVNDNGVAIGASTLDSTCSLENQSTTKGTGLSRVAGNLGTTRNGNIWYHSAENVYKGIQNASVVTFATTANTNLTIQFGWKYTYSANTALYQMLNDTGSTKWIAVDACSIYALTLNFGTAPTSNYQVFYNKNGTGWTSFNTTDTAANTHDVSIKPSTAITMAANDTIQFRLNQGADGVSMNIIIKS